MNKLLAAAAVAATLATPAQAIIVNTYSTLAGWQAAVGAGSLLQDFSGYTANDSVQGATILPNVTVSTNLGVLQVRDPGKKIFGFGNGATNRQNGDAYYNFEVGNAWRAMGFELTDFESAEAPYNVAGGAVGSGFAEFLFEDGFSFQFQLFGDDGDQYQFFGVLSDTPITRVRWIEAHEANGVNEESSMDNIRVALATSRVPEPSSLALVAAGLLGWAARRRPAAR